MKKRTVIKIITARQRLIWNMACEKAEHAMQELQKLMTIIHWGTRRKIIIRPLGRTIIDDFLERDLARDDNYAALFAFMIRQNRVTRG